MDQAKLRALLDAVGAGELDTDEALRRLASLPFDDMGFARVDHHRSLRQGFPEVIYGAGKTSDQISSILKSQAAAGSNTLVTRIEGAKAAALCAAHPEAQFHETARIVTHLIEPPSPNGRGTVMVVTAGTSDMPVAEEAAVTLETFGQPVERIYDIGISGLHRLLSEVDRLQQAQVIVVAAGMEAALPSVVSGLVSCPIVAVPTSVGYGASFGGITALLGMLNACASGIGVVNIDNGFGAGYLAAQINR